MHAAILCLALALGLSSSHAGTRPAEDMHLLYRPEPARADQPYRLVALSPNFNLTPEQLAIAARRSHLPFPAKLECSALDTRLPTLERTAKRTPPEQKPEAEHTLSLARQRYAALRC
ncbi:MAG: hypothetical protein RR855_12055 [Comamonas sp.]